MLKEILVDTKLLEKMALVPLSPEQQFICLAFLQLSDSDGTGLLRASDGEVAEALGLNPKYVGRVRRLIELNTDLIRIEWVQKRELGPFCATKVAEWKWAHSRVTPLGGTWATIHTYLHLLTYARDGVVMWNRRVVRGGMIRQCGRHAHALKHQLRILRRAGIIERKRGSVIRVARLGAELAPVPQEPEKRDARAARRTDAIVVPAGHESLLNVTLDVAAATVRGHPGMAYEAPLEQKREYNSWAQLLKDRLDSIRRMSEVTQALPTEGTDGHAARRNQLEEGMRGMFGELYDRMDKHATKADAVAALGRDLSKEEARFLFERKLALKTLTDPFRCYLHSNLPDKVEPLPPAPVLTESEMRPRTERLLELWKTVHATVLGSTAVRTSADWKGARMIILYLNRGRYFPGPYEEQAFQALEIVLKALAEQCLTRKIGFKLSWVKSQLHRDAGSWRPQFDEAFQALRVQTDPRSSERS